MFNHEKLKNVLTRYKQDFIPTDWWECERYKWKAAKWFHDKWDLEAQDFPGMLKLALKETDTLLATNNHYPREMIIDFAEGAPEEVREMFRALFVDNADVYERMATFKSHAPDLLKKYGNDNENHFQDENAISTYLWLHDPCKYYIYKFKSAKKSAVELDASYSFKAGAFENNIRNCIEFYDEIREDIKKDAELLKLVKLHQTDDCYPDPELRTLTSDIAYYISMRIAEEATKTPAAQQAKAEPAAPAQDNSAQLNPTPAVSAAGAYTKDDFLKEVYMTEARYDKLTAVLRRKKNIILQGAPGVGKTFVARRLAWSMMGEKDDSRIEFVQLHQNYSYEDFVMGYKPVEDGFELKYGIFYRFCQKAANQPDKDFFFLIDEINRGNLSKIFGELLVLIEKDYRGTQAELAYNGLPFSVPQNLYLIGMMNTADRSLAMIDYALRRRFSFFEMEPGFDSEGFLQYQNSLNSEALNQLIDKVKELNREISRDKSLGKGFCIGHSYFCGEETCTGEWLRAIVEFDILPMLSEYWFDDTDKLQKWENILQGALR